jgi:hypothetical protein
MRGLRFKKGDMDCANGLLVSEVEKLVPRAIIAIPDEHATKRFGEYFVPIAVFQAEENSATADLNNV